MTKPKNVLGTELIACCTSPMTGYYRDGYCRTGSQDYGAHVVCAKISSAFLEFTKSQGNDLSTPIPHYNFSGLRPGDHWCLCASRWQEALNAGVAPQVILEATHVRALEIVSFSDLKQYRYELN
ncbi:DUF2237 family protein [Cyanobacterium sp. uoEpiScrs1]|uniref:DUF2237 family protein n=1 Tax=Cyanobacterium sp. uoEpiScrs1 TaxID=2976343 RepID=UPI00226AC547|nr:DUF2237 domain-containing protein [Cyanobacterium sp. uoEpiScrs1]